MQSQLDIIFADEADPKPFSSYLKLTADLGIYLLEQLPKEEWATVESAQCSAPVIVNELQPHKRHNKNIDKSKTKSAVYKPWQT